MTPHRWLEADRQYGYVLEGCWCGATCTRQVGSQKRLVRSGGGTYATSKATGEAVPETCEEWAIYEVHGS